MPPDSDRNCRLSDFEGSETELEGLLLDGLSSKELTEEEFWSSVDRDTNAMLAAHKARRRS